MVPPAFAGIVSALLCGNGRSGLFMAFESLSAGSLPVKAPGWRPGQAVNSDYTDAAKDVKENIEKCYIKFKSELYKAEK